MVEELLAMEGKRHSSGRGAGLVWGLHLSLQALCEHPLGLALPNTASGFSLLRV